MLVQTQPTANFSSVISSALTPQAFYEAYCWVVFSRAIGESRLLAVWPCLAEIYAGFDPYTVGQNTVMAAQEWLDSETLLGPSQAALMIQLLGWENFQQQFIHSISPQQSLSTLRGLAWMGAHQLGHLLNMGWAD
jgi:hypothetical protein